jgi:hypothetical protein
LRVIARENTGGEMLNAEERAVLLAAREYKKAAIKAEGARKAYYAVKNIHGKNAPMLYDKYLDLFCEAADALTVLTKAANALD